MESTNFFSPCSSNLMTIYSSLQESTLPNPNLGCSTCALWVKAGFVAMTRGESFGSDGSDNSLLQKTEIHTTPAPVRGKSLRWEQPGRQWCLLGRWSGTLDGRGVGGGHDDWLPVRYPELGGSGGSRRRGTSAARRAVFGRGSGV